MRGVLLKYFLISIALCVTVQFALASEPAPAAASNAGTSYPIVLEDGCPVLASYEYRGVSIKPTIDTGSPNGVVVPGSALLKWVAPGTPSLGFWAHAYWDGSLLLQLPALGSGRLRQMSAQDWGDTYYADAPSDPTAVSDSIFPLDIFDGNCVAFLSSQTRLWVGDNPPSPAPAIALQIIPYFEWTTGTYVNIVYRGKLYLMSLDTGSVNTFFDHSFLEAHPELFGEPGKQVEQTAGDAYLQGNLYPLKQPLTVAGMDKDSQTFQIPAGPVGVIRLTASKTDPTPVVDSPYQSLAAPNLLPVGTLGMDVLGKFDFMLLRREKLLVVWDPKYTAQFFPQGK